MRTQEKLTALFGNLRLVNSCPLMASFSAIGGYALVLFSICVVLYYLVAYPSVHVRNNAIQSNEFNLVSNPKLVQHHPIAEHANILSTDFYNSFTTLNRIFSPLGLAYALALTQAAAEGASANELAAVLGGEYTMDDLHKVLNLFHKDKSVLLNIVTYWSVHYNSTIQNSFVERTQGLCTISQDNYNDQERIIHKINQIFSNQTNGHINSAAKAIRPSTSSVLINTLYFETLWQEAFDPRLTFTTNFTQHVGTLKNIPMMSKTAFFDYYESFDTQLVEVPFNVPAYVFGAILPHRNLVNPPMPHFNLTTLMVNIHRMRKKKLTLQLPKFKHKRMIR
jgi:serine protease inhibitor